MSGVAPFAQSDWPTLNVTDRVSNHLPGCFLFFPTKGLMSVSKRLPWAPYPGENVRMHSTDLENTASVVFSSLNS